MRKPKEKLKLLCDCEEHENQVCDICQDKHSPYEGEGYHIPKEVENSETFLDQVVKLKKANSALLEALHREQERSEKWREEYLHASNDAMRYAAKCEEAYKAVKALYKSLEVI